MKEQQYRGWRLCCNSEELTANGDLWKRMQKFPNSCSSETGHSLSLRGALFVAALEIQRSIYIM